MSHLLHWLGAEVTVARKWLGLKLRWKKIIRPGRRPRAYIMGFFNNVCVLICGKGGAVCWKRNIYSRFYSWLGLKGWNNVGPASQTVAQHYIKHFWLTEEQCVTRIAVQAKTQWCFNGGPASKTLGQHWNSIGYIAHVCLECYIYSGKHEWLSWLSVSIKNMLNSSLLKSTKFCVGIQSSWENMHSPYMISSVWAVHQIYEWCCY